MGGFTPDPHITEVRAGGGTDSGDTVPNCDGGYISDPPDLELRYSDPADNLGFFVSSNEDTSLVINDPSGGWHCNDDFSNDTGLNPGLLFDDPKPGIYDIWVGAYTSNGIYSHAQLIITELGESMLASDEDGEPEEGSEERTPSVNSSGTGIVVSRAGHILTNHHVVDQCTRQTFQLRGGATVDAQLVSVNADTDLALLLSDISVEPARFRGGQNVRLGDEVVVYGFPLSRDLSSQGNLTSGVISALSGLDDDLSRLQMTAQIQPGNSGGPMMDRAGRVVGIVAERANEDFFRRQRGAAIQNLNFAIRSSLVFAFLDINNVDYTVADTPTQQTIADIAQQAQSFTGIIECYQ